MRKDVFLNKTFQVYGPENTSMACEACVYDRGEHASWCDKNEGYRLIGTDPASGDSTSVVVFVNPPHNHPNPGGSDK